MSLDRTSYVMYGIYSDKTHDIIKEIKKNENLYEKLISGNKNIFIVGDCDSNYAVGILLSTIDDHSKTFMSIKESDYCYLEEWTSFFINFCKLFDVNLEKEELELFIFNCWR